MAFASSYIVRHLLAREVHLSMPTGSKDNVDGL